MNKEIERKFLIIDYSINDLEIQHSRFKVNNTLIIQQLYINTYRDREMRYRKSFDTKNRKFSYTKTEKIGYGMTREETEVSVPNVEFIVYARRCLPIEKTRYVCKNHGRDLIIDGYMNVNIPLVCEIEFNSEQEANNFTPYKWLGKEVTDIKEFKNYYIFKELNKEGDVDG